MLPIYSLIVVKVKKLLKETDIGILCIDGPTAAGKTILAEGLAKILTKELSINVDFYRLDWTLKERIERENDLKVLMNDNEDFYFEGELHMHLEKYKKFLQEIRLINKNNANDAKLINKFHVKELYSRENNGRCNGEYTYEFNSKKTLIICEGHYTSRSEFRNLIDLNICLLAERQELLDRKINRVKGYRSPQAAIDYFNKIDIPSFSYHISRFHNNVDIFIDNTNYKKPFVLSKKNIEQWLLYDLNNNKICIANKEINFDNLYKKIFSSSKIFNLISLEEFKKIFNLYIFLDNLISSKLRNNTKNYDTDIQDIVSEELNKISICSKLDKKNINLKIVSSSSLYDVYQRKIPVGIGIKIERSINDFIYVNFNINYNFVEILFLWEGSASEIQIKRSLNDLEKVLDPKEIYFKNISLQNLINQKEDLNKTKILYSPTDFCIPAFLKDEKYNIVYTGREHELTLIYDVCKKIINNSETILCHRISLYSELNFFKSFLESCGINCLSISNYLIGLNSNNKDLIESFQSWSRNWISVEKSNKFDQDKYDFKIKKEIIEANQIVLKSHKSFMMIDSFLFEKQKKHDMNQIINDLRNMMKSSNRIVRKRAFEYIVNEQSSLQINTSKFLSINNIESEKLARNTFPLKDLPILFPSIMSEIYLWQHIRDDSGAILGANVYDIDQINSLDIEGILEAASESLTPVVIQSSFNALGQKGFCDGKEYSGYLKLQNGANQLVDSCIKSNFKNFLVKGSKRTFFGIGLDHVDARNDKPIGRAKEFLETALETGNITHIVLDGSFLFKAENRDKKNIYKAYKEVANYAISLLNTKNEIFLIDLEYCVGEMNYIGDLSESMIPSSEEIRIFTNIVRTELTNIGKGYFNCRPSLFIGNVGTTHHTSDNKSIDSSITLGWVEKVKDQNFISAVLHGTTNSNPSILKNSIKGCHKVNVAGDFLKIYQNSLPERFGNKFRDFGPNSKYQIPEIRKIKDNLKIEEKEHITFNLKKGARNVIDIIASPKLTQKDMDYFHRSSFYFNSNLIEYILTIFKDAKSNFSKNKFEISNYKNISFSASMIEVPYEEGFLEFANGLINLGLKYFHIDVGDGNFISRKFSGIKKLEYLSSLGSELNLHTHLMVDDPFSDLSNNKSYIDSYIEAGATSIGIHTRSFKNKKSLKYAISYIKEAGCRPGIVLEVNQNDYQELWSLINYLEINWVIVMGVPIGYGGQLFQTPSLKKINYLRKMSINSNFETFDIEVDGGLTVNNILDCFNSGANIFAGWSIIKDSKSSLVSKNYINLVKQLKE